MRLVAQSERDLRQASKHLTVVGECWRYNVTNRQLVRLLVVVVIVIVAVVVDVSERFVWLTIFGSDDDARSAI